MTKTYFNYLVFVQELITIILSDKKARRKTLFIILNKSFENTFTFLWFVWLVDYKHLYYYHQNYKHQNYKNLTRLCSDNNTFYDLVQPDIAM